MRARACACVRVRAHRQTEMLVFLDLFVHGIGLDVCEGKRGEESEIRRSVRASCARVCACIAHTCECVRLPSLPLCLSRARALSLSCVHTAGQTVIFPVSEPIKETGHLQTLYGNLAPEGSVAKITGKEGLTFKGVAIVYDCEEVRGVRGGGKRH